MSVCCPSVCGLEAHGEVMSEGKIISPRKSSLFSGLVPWSESKTYLQGGAVKEKMGGVIVESKRGRMIELNLVEWLVDRTCCRGWAMWPIVVSSASGQYREAKVAVRPGHDA